MAKVTRRGDGYTVRWRTLDGRRKPRRQCTTLRAANAIKREIEEAHSRGIEWEPRASGGAPPIREVATAYVEAMHVQQLADETLRRYGTALDLFTRFLASKWKHALAITTDLSRPLLDEFHGWLYRPENALHGGKTNPDGSTRGKPRSIDTVRKIVEAVHLFWEWADECERWPGDVPRPRRIKLARGIPQEVVAPTWAEMAACVAAANGWQRCALTWLYYTGMRVTESMRVEWADVDFDRGTLTIRAETTKTGGRTVPLHPALLDAIATWGVRTGYVIPSGRCKGVRERQVRGRDIARAWERAGVREVVWRGRPDHAFRKGFKTGLRALGADADAVDFLQGHITGGSRAKYIDAWQALPLRQTIGMVPRLGSTAAGNVVTLRKAGS